MKKIHHIGERWDAHQVNELAKFGIIVNEGVLSNIQIEQGLFEQVKDIILINKPIHVFGAEFDKHDLNSAEWLSQTPLRTFGYPQPDDSFDFLDSVYDQTGSCKACGIVPGFQKSPFRIKTDMTTYPGFSLGWVYDEIFVKIQIYQEIFEPLGIGYWPVLIHRTGAQSTNIVQLKLLECDWKFDMSGIPFETCTVCWRKKYQARPLDFLPSLLGEPPNQIFRGTEFYGSGGQADQRIYVSKSLRLELLRLKVAKWYQYYPLKSL